MEEPHAPHHHRLILRIITWTHSCRSLLRIIIRINCCWLKRVQLASIQMYFSILKRLARGLFPAENQKHQKEWLWLFDFYFFKAGMKLLTYYYYCLCLNANLMAFINALASCVHMRACRPITIQSSAKVWGENWLLPLLRKKDFPNVMVMRRRWWPPWWLQHLPDRRQLLLYYFQFEIVITTISCVKQPTRLRVISVDLKVCALGKKIIDINVWSKDIKSSSTQYYLIKKMNKWLIEIN